MNKLLATSALVAASLWGTTEAAFAQAKVAPISVVVGGYHEQVMVYGRNKANAAYGGTLGTPTSSPSWVVTILESSRSRSSADGRIRS